MEFRELCCRTRMFSEDWVRCVLRMIRMRATLASCPARLRQNATGRNKKSKIVKTLCVGFLYVFFVCLRAVLDIRVTSLGGLGELK